MWRFIAFVLLVLAGTLGVIYYKGVMDADNAAKTITPTKVELAKVQEGIRLTNTVVPPVTISQPLNIIRDLVYVRGASITPRYSQEVTSRIEGLVEEIKVQPGQIVQVGEILFSLDKNLAKVKTKAAKMEVDKAIANIAKADKQIDLYIQTRKREDMAGSAMQESEKDVTKARLALAQVEKITAEQEHLISIERQKEADETLKMHDVTSEVAGRIVRVNKKKGELIRAGEVVVEIINENTLWVDGSVTTGTGASLKENQKVLIQPEVNPPEILTLTGHTSAITSVAISPDNQFLVSSSEDGTVILWQWRNSKLPLKSWRGSRSGQTVRSVAFSPVLTSNTYQFLMGVEDGSTRLVTFTVNSKGQLEDSIKELPAKHESAVQSVCFSPDGKYAATGGGNDRSVFFWDLMKPEKLYSVQAESGMKSHAHFGQLTTVSFTTINNELHLVTAATDNTIKLWKLGQKEAELKNQAQGRSGDVSQFTLNGNGKYLLADHADELRLLDVATMQTVSLVSSHGQTRFQKLSLISPNGDYVLTSNEQGKAMLIVAPKQVATGSPESHISNAWPVDTVIRNFVPPQAVKTTCATFSRPSANNTDRFVFLGFSDHKIRVWDMPGLADLGPPVEGKLTFISPKVDGTSNMIRIRAEFQNPQEAHRRIRDGQHVNFTILP